MDTSNTQNNVLLDEYIANLSKSLSDKTLEFILITSKLSVALKEKEKMKSAVLEKTQEVDALNKSNQALILELNAEKANIKIREVEVIKEVIVEKKISNDDITELEDRNKKLLQELQQTDTVIKKYKKRISDLEAEFNVNNN
jgi:hypothetical protein